MSEAKKTCFVIAPIGSKGSDTRARSDQVLKYIIRPAARQCGYQVERADQLSKPGIITFQIIQKLVEAEIVVADLTDHNANVFYELAIRHVLGKPVVQLLQAGQSLPFDVAPSRTIMLDHRDLDSVNECKAELVREIRAVEADPASTDNLISISLDLLTARRNPDDTALSRTIEDAIRSTLNSTSVIERIATAASTGMQTGIAGAVKSVAAETVEKVHDTSFLTIDSRLLLKSAGGVWQVGYANYSTVDEFLNDLWYLLTKSGADLPARSFGLDWCLNDTQSGSKFANMGRAWARLHGSVTDNRTLQEVGILPGMHLSVVSSR
jgi:hypothetical protein